MGFPQEDGSVASYSQEDDVSVSDSEDPSTDDDDSKHELEHQTPDAAVPVTAEDDVDIPDYESSHGSRYSEHSSFDSTIT